MKIKNNFINSFLALLLFGSVFIFSSCSDSGSFAKKGSEHFQLGPSLNIPRASHSATLLKDGRVLIAGGYTMGHPDKHPKGDVLQAEIYDPKTNKFTLTGT